MGCAGPNLTAGSAISNSRPVKPGESVVEVCFDYFEAAASPESSAAFALHVVGLEADDDGAVFAMVSAEASSERQYFVARWGRTGVGPTRFLPVPAQIDDNRPGVMLYGEKVTNFTWRNYQWEIVSLAERNAIDSLSLEADHFQIPANSDDYWVFQSGRPIANIDGSSTETLATLGIIKERDPEAPHEDSYRVKFGGRVWRRHKTKPGHPTAGVDWELLAFDPESANLQNSLDEVWGDIGGQEEAKRELVRAIQWPVLYPELFVLFKRRRSRGVLLYGPPGTGKTLLGKAVVKLLATLYNRKADDGGFQYVKGHQLLDQYVGNSEKAVKALFDRARRWKQEKGYPSVLFFDEADALFGKRSPSDQERSFSLVPALLAEMDGMDESGAFVVLATNRPDALDLAVTRPGRIDRKIRVTRPDQSATAQIFRIHLDGVLLQQNWTLEQLSEEAASILFSPDWTLYQLRLDDGDTASFGLKDLVSGAVIQNLVDRATANKMEYCIEHGQQEGLSPADLRQAAQEWIQEQRLLRHREEIAEWQELNGKIVLEFERISILGAMINNI
jgi:hypothetical protein